MRKLVSLLLSAAVIWLLSAPVFAASEIKVLLDGSAVTFDAAPYVENGRTMVPVRALSEALGFTVGWNEADQSITLTRGDTSISLWVDSTRVMVNGKESKLEVPVRKVGSRTFVPLRFVAETLGAYVTWDNEKQAASVTSGKALTQHIAKSMQEPVDQLARGTIDMVISLKGTGIPGGGITMPTAMTVFTHVYQKQMLSQVSVQPPIGPAVVTTVAARDGNIYSKQSEAAEWTKAGTYNPANFSEAYSFSGLQGIDSTKLQKEMLSSAAVTVVGAAEVDGVKVLQVRVDMSKAGLETAIMQQALAGMPLGSGEAPGMSISTERFLVDYFVNPATGLVHRTDMDMAITMQMQDATGGGTMGLAMKGSMTYTYASEPIQFPADLPK